MHRPGAPMIVLSSADPSWWGLVHVMAIFFSAFLARHPEPLDQTLRQALSVSLCRGSGNQVVTAANRGWQPTSAGPEGRV